MNLKELLAKAADRLSELRNDPERREDRIAAVIIGVTAMVVIVLLLVLLWSRIVQDQKASGAGNGSGGQAADTGLTAAVYEESLAEYGALREGQEELRQQYLTDMESMGNQVNTMLDSLTQAEQELSLIMNEYRQEDQAIGQKVSGLYVEVTAVVESLRETQTELYELVEDVRNLQEEKLTGMQAQIAGTQTDVEQLYASVDDIYARLSELAQEDSRLQGEIDKAGSRIGGLESNTLQYRYDEESNTLYLAPYAQ